MARKTAKKPVKAPCKTAAAKPAKPQRTDGRRTGPGAGDAPPDGAERRNGGWREIEALREKAALKASLADVWDEDFDLDEEILAELDHTAEFFTTQEEEEEQLFEEDEEDGEEFYEDDEV